MKKRFVLRRKSNSQRSIKNNDEKISNLGATFGTKRVKSEPLQLQSRLTPCAGGIFNPTDLGVAPN